MIAWKRYLFGGSAAALSLFILGCALTSVEQSGGDADALARMGEPKILARTHLAAAHLHESQGHLARAAQQYHLAVNLDPKNVAALNRLGVILDRLGRFKQADKRFEQAIAVAPNEAYLHNNLAFSYIMQHTWADAEVELVRALELHPTFIRARINLAMVLSQQRRFEEAETEFMIALSPGDAHYNMGLMYKSQRYEVEAARSFMRALEIEPKLVAARKRLDKLPPDAVLRAEELGIAIASPVSPAEFDATSDGVMSERPASQPSMAELKEPGADSDIEVAAIEEPAFDPFVQAATPVSDDETPCEEEDEFTEETIIAEASANTETRGDAIADSDADTDTDGDNPPAIEKPVVTHEWATFPTQMDVSIEMDLDYDSGLWPHDGLRMSDRLIEVFNFESADFHSTDGGILRRFDLFRRIGLVLDAMVTPMQHWGELASWQDPFATQASSPFAPATQPARSTALPSTSADVSAPPAP